MFKNISTVKKIVARMQVKHCCTLTVQTLNLIQFFIFNLEQVSQETCFIYKIFVLFVLLLVYYSFLQVARGKFIGKQRLKDAFVKLKVKKTEWKNGKENFYQSFYKLEKKVSFCRWFLRENNRRKTTTAQEIQADQIF